MPLQETSGNVTTDAYGGGVAAVTNYIEDVFSTYLYTGNNTYPRQLINGIDLAGKGGLIWSKVRNISGDHFTVDTATAPSGNSFLQPSLTNALASSTTYSYNNNGYTFQSTNENYGYDQYNFVSWTFRKQPKFFDIVTYTGNGTASYPISHNLGSVPGFILIKKTSAASYWFALARQANNSYALFYFNSGLNSTAAANFSNYAAETYGSISSTIFNPPTMSGTSDGGVNDINANGATYVAYLFAHNAGGFGLTGTDNVISCGGVTANSSGDASINLGYEPQWLLTKRTDTTGNWELRDTMRGFGAASGFVTGALLRPNTSGAEASPAGGFYLTATGFEIGNGMPSNATYIYIAIRRGPMKVPTDATSVFAPVAYTGNSSTQTITTNFPVDLMLSQLRSGSDSTFIDRLRGFGTATNATKYLFGDLTDAEGGVTNGVLGMTNTGLNLGSWAQTNFSSEGYASWNMRRAPSFFDEVCYTGNDVVGRTITHNLTVTPQMMIVKDRSVAQSWVVYVSSIGNTGGIRLNSNAAVITTDVYWNNTSPTSSVFTVGSVLNQNTENYVAYLFATTAGVSKVGSYTGNGTTQTINCGFTGGSRFVLIKRTDSTGDWYVYDTARGMTTLTDPYLLLDSTAAESATLGSVTTVSTGFAVNATVLAAINTNAASYIFLAVAQT